MNGEQKDKCAPTSKQLSFQRRVSDWMMETFSMEVTRDTTERNHRFLEEALELVQSLNCSREEAHMLVDYVFGRPIGAPEQEVGGVTVTLAALCNAADMDVIECGERELSRCWLNIDRIRAKRAGKPRNSPLSRSSRDETTAPVWKRMRDQVPADGTWIWWDYGKGPMLQRAQDFASEDDGYWIEATPPLRSPEEPSGTARRREPLSAGLMECKSTPEKATEAIPPLCDCDPDFGCKEYDPAIFRCCQQEMEKRAAQENGSEAHNKGE